MPKPFCHDYYQILGIKKTADQSDIKRAYRTLIALYHPDKGGTDFERAMLINEAYETLKDPVRRADYDAWYAVQFGVAGILSPTWGELGASVGRFFKSAEQNIRHNLKHSPAFAQARSALSQFADSLDDDAGELSISLDVAMRGGSVSFVYQGRTVHATLPQGLHHGAKIKLTLPQEAVWFAVRVLTDADTRTDKKDIHRTVYVYPWSVALSQMCTIVHFGETLTLPLPPLDKLHLPHRLTGKGIPATPSDPQSQAGDLYVHFHLTLPPVHHLTDEQKRAFIALQDSFLI